MPRSRSPKLSASIALASPNLPRWWSLTQCSWWRSPNCLREAPLWKAKRTRERARCMNLRRLRRLTGVIQCASQCLLLTSLPSIANVLSFSFNSKPAGWAKKIKRKSKGSRCQTIDNCKPCQRTQIQLMYLLSQMTLRGQVLRRSIVLHFLRDRKRQGKHRRHSRVGIIDWRVAPQREWIWIQENRWSISAFLRLSNCQKETKTPKSRPPSQQDSRSTHLIRERANKWGHIGRHLHCTYQPSSASFLAKIKVASTKLLRLRLI